jgi:hypothetical protein
MRAGRLWLSILFCFLVITVQAQRISVEVADKLLKL